MEIWLSMIWIGAGVINLIILIWFIITLNRINASCISIKENTEYANELLKHQIQTQNPAALQ